MNQSLKEIKENWEEFAKKDPLWSILPIPDKKNNRWDIKELFATGKKEIDSVMEFLKTKDLQIEKERALDFGCGVGRLTQALADYFKECIGVDISNKMIELAIQFNQRSEKCKFITNYSKDLSIFANNYFDLIYSNLVFQHLGPEYSLGYIKEFLRIIKPGGIIIFQLVIDEIGYSTKIRGLLRRFIPKPFRQFYKNIRYGTWAIKDMYCIDAEVLNGFIKNEGGRIVDIIDDNSALPRYLGRKYFICK